MRVLITGATGLIGQEIVKLCQERDIAVNYLTTNNSKISKTENYRGFYWNPKTQDIDTGCFKNIDAIIHLAGATVSKRWTIPYKKEILSSRKVTTQLLINALKGETHTIKQVISASAIGIYSGSLTNYYEEDSKNIGHSFLSEVVQVWEQEVDAFTKLNIAVSKIRIGLVLAEKGGALQEMVKPIRFGLGAAFGSGKQWQSWIHVQDLANMFLYAVENNLNGIYNGVAPNPVTNNELIKTIASVMSKPLFLPNIPKFFLKSVLGEMHTLLFESQRVSSKKIENKGFLFKYHHLRSALEDLLD
ncbi:TIGR01777 family oxidoreductase [Flavivirga spongiicola]|uniref:TIGR01777 family oxidoreductase n=1 Tax=Flavivirga spongiicola TaxID=421621 RepID=A0ABU7XPY1_9FLAO|nr:TIGR01777 family oxidoreductase [Flavivirga sp. MEBiC05379]MDO5977581.1 TIGR01777 family oxidoreductase [Flavivirga sp. MEBiC05379]